jgi:hypothetical protein
MLVCWVHITSPSIAAHYASGFDIYLFWKSSQQLNEMMGSIKSPHQNRYIRLIALSSVQIFCGLPMTAYAIYFNARVIPLNPWISWDDTHFDYSFVGQYPADVWRTNSAASSALELNRWYFVGSAFIYFAFFGFAEEARKHYRMAYSFASTRLRLPEFNSTRASKSSPNTLANSSFGPGFKKGMASLFSFKGGFSVLGSGVSQHDVTRERNASFSAPENRWTSDTSIFEGLDDIHKVVGIQPDEGHTLRAPAPVFVTMPAIPRRVPVPPVSNINSLSIPPGRLNSPLPHRPTSSYLDVPEDV